MYAWGETSVASCFNLEQKLVKPERVPFGNNPIKTLATADHSCCLLLHDGSVHTFGHKAGNSLGHDSSSTKVSALEALNIVDAFAGGGHIFVISEKGLVYGWGSNEKGQLGWRDLTENAIVPVPKSLKFFQFQRVVQVSCGKLHSLILLQDGALYSMGDNTFGQLGIGNFSEFSQPAEIASLRGIPIMQIATGGWHSFCVTFSGKVFCWGKNDFGQLGLGDRCNRSAPNLLKMLQSQVVMYVAAGESHTAVLTKDGGVFTFGCASRGQLGHGSSTTECEVNPRKVFELMGNVVTQVACGYKHTVAYVSESKNVFTCGCGENGQLGQGEETKYLNVPTVVKGQWLQSDEGTSRDNNSQYPGASLYNNIKQVGADGNQTFVIMCSSSDETLDFRNVLSHRRIHTLDADLCNRVSHLSEDSAVSQDIILRLECVMSSQSCMNGCFLASDHHNTGTKYSGLNLMEATLLFSKLCQSNNKKIIKTIQNGLSTKLIPSITSNPPHVEALRLFICMPVLKLLRDPFYYDDLLFPFAEKLLKLAENPSKILDIWYRKLEPVHFETPIRMCQKCIIATVKLGLPPPEVKHKVTLMLEYLQKLNRVNNMDDSPIVDFRKFHIEELNSLIPLEADYQQWTRSEGADFSFCKYPFVFDSKAKTSILQIDAKTQMQTAFQQARGQNMAAFLGLSPLSIEPPVIEIEVKRDRLVEDAVNQIANIKNLKRPFTVKFKGEEGQDAGGVRKEFFMLILREILNPKYGMFREYDSKLLWFCDYELETDKMFLLIGTICGLAIYNSTIIDLNFPLALYKKLLGVQPVLNDLKELDPMVGKGLQQLLDYVEDGDTIADVFCLNFTIRREMFGEITHVDLVPHGETIMVTADNREQYVQAYVKYVFNESVERPFEQFSKGFHKVCGGEVMNLFRPDELQEMIVGNQDYNWDELERTTEYKGVYYRQHQVIMWFWEVFHTLTFEEKKDFLMFLTGCNKVPINGLKFYIQPMNIGDDYLPVAHTCFNLLDLPPYSSKKQLEIKLKQAIKDNQGFHLA